MGPHLIYFFLNTRKGVQMVLIEDVWWNVAYFIDTEGKLHSERCSAVKPWSLFEAVSETFYARIWVFLQDKIKSYKSSHLIQKPARAGTNSSISFGSGMLGAAGIPPQFFGVPMSPVSQSLGCELASLRLQQVIYSRHGHRFCSWSLSENRAILR